MRKLTESDGTMAPDLDKSRTCGVGAVSQGTAREMFHCRIGNEDCMFAMPFGFDYLCSQLTNHGFPTSEDAGHGKVIAMFLADSSGKFLKA